MNSQQAKSIREAVAQCNAFIAKEAPRAADLRPAKTAALLAWYYGHRAKLIAMLGE